MMNTLSVREIQLEDIDPLLNYWYGADEDFLLAMGVDPNLMPDRESFRQMLQDQINTSYENKKAYCLIWLHDNKPVGHCNVNPVNYGQEAWMHLHLWQTDNRLKGMGTELIRLSTPLFFEKLKLKKLISMPYSLNPAPNYALRKAGFSFIEEEFIKPGFNNFEQHINRWELKASGIVDELL